LDYRREVEDLFRHFLHEGEAAPSDAEFHPPMNILETKSELVVELELPGVDSKDVHVSMEDGTLSIRGERKFEPDPNYDLLKKECWYGRFHRYLSIPQTVSREKISADYKNGMLRIVLPKAPEAQKKEIKINVT
jgi:HSP20 family protein